MRAPDSGLRALFHRRMPRIHWQGIEVGVLGRGIPDTNYCADGVEGWVEFKATETGRCELRPEQVGWILRRMRAGGRVFVATRWQHGGGPRLGDPVDGLLMHEGWDVVQLRDEGCSVVPPVLETWGGPSRWDWGRVEETLLRWEMSRR